MTSCFMLSLFTNVTVPPSRTVINFGGEACGMRRRVADAGADGSLGAGSSDAEGC